MPVTARAVASAPAERAARLAELVVRAGLVRLAAPVVSVRLAVLVGLARPAVLLVSGRWQGSAVRVPVAPAQAASEALHRIASRI